MKYYRTLCRHEDNNYSKRSLLKTDCRIYLHVDRLLTKHLAEMSYKKLSVVVCSLFFLYYIAVSPICDEERRGCPRSFMASYRRCALYMHSNVANIMWQYCLI